jgi:hypothetical protein
MRNNGANAMSTRPPSLWNRSQKIGQLVRCRIVSRTTGGYFVLIEGEDKNSFLECESDLSVRQEVLARVQTMDRRGCVLRPEFTQGSSQRPARAAFDPNAIEESYVDTQPQPTDSPLIQALKYKRIFDLIPQVETTEVIAAADCSFIDEFVSYIEGGMRTAFIKGTCAERQSRFLLLCYQGRLVGCSYGRRDFPAASGLPVQESLKLALEDLSSPTSTAELTDVSESLILAMAALYMGNSIETPAMSLSDAFSAIANQFQQRQLTGAIAVCNSHGQSVGFVYACSGALVGYFDVVTQQFCAGLDALKQRLSEDGTTLHATILPAISRHIGFSLSILSHPTAQQTQ